MFRLLLIVALFVFKHFLADWVFQTQWMVDGKGRKHGWLLPLAAHAGLHGIFTFVLMWIYSKSFVVGLICGLIDFSAHFAIDRVKSSPAMFGSYKQPDSKYFWILLGADQAAHQATYLAIVFGYLVIK